MPLQKISEQEDRYDEAWDEFRRLRNRYRSSVAVLLVLFPALVILAIFVEFPSEFSFTLDVISLGVFLLVFMLSVIAVIVAASRFFGWRCPRCRHRYYDVFAPIHGRFPGDRCGHCGLNEYESEQPKSIVLK